MTHFIFYCCSRTYFSLSLQRLIAADSDAVKNIIQEVTYLVRSFIRPLILSLLFLFKFLTSFFEFRKNWLVTPTLSILSQPPAIKGREALKSIWSSQNSVLEVPWWTFSGHGTLL